MYENYKQNKMFSKRKIHKLLLSDERKMINSLNLLQWFISRWQQSDLDFQTIWSMKLNRKCIYEKQYTSKQSTAEIKSTKMNNYDHQNYNELVDDKLILRVNKAQMTWNDDYS